MEKYKVISVFRDKLTKKVYMPGDEFESGDSDRVFNLHSRGLIEVNPNSNPNERVVGGNDKDPSAKSTEETTSGVVDGTDGGSSIKADITEKETQSSPTPVKDEPKKSRGAAKKDADDQGTTDAY